MARVRNAAHEVSTSTARSVAVISCVYPPEPVVSGRTSKSLADGLAEKGHAVTVVAPFPNRPGGKAYPDFSRGWIRTEETREGVTIRRFRSWISRESSLASRLAENVSFALASAVELARMRRPDVVYANTWPVFGQGAVALVARARGIPLVISVQDVYPESLVAQGRLGPDSFATRALRRIDTWVAENSTRIVPISERFAEQYVDGRRVPAERVHVVPNWLDGADLPPAARPSDLRDRLGISPTTRVVVYGGNVGVAAGVDNAIEAFANLPRDVDAVFLIAGDGSEFDACVALARRLGTTKVVFHRPWLADETLPVLTAADLLLLPTRGEQSLVSVPSKLLSYMMAGRAVLAQAVPSSDLAGIIDASRCGWWVDARDPNRLREELARVLGLGDRELVERGEAGRRYFEEHFSKAACLPRLEALVEQAAGARDGGETSLREMNRRDVDAVVAVHLDAFPGFFLSFLGPKFLRELYLGILDDPAGIAVVASRAEQVLGFVVGTTRPAAFYRRLLRRRLLRFAVASALPAARSPAIVPRLLRAFRRSGDPESQRGAATLMSLAVSPRAQGAGLGSSLVDQFRARACARGASAINLTTDAVKNDATRRFYERLGFQSLREFTTSEGRPMVEYILALSGDA